MADWLLIIGIFVALFAIPMILAELSEGRRPIRSVIVFMIGGGAIGGALLLSPQPYKLADIPYVALGLVVQLLS